MSKKKKYTIGGTYHGGPIGKHQWELPSSPNTPGYEDYGSMYYVPGGYGLYEKPRDYSKEYAGYGNPANLLSNQQDPMPVYTGPRAPIRGVKKNNPDNFYVGEGSIDDYSIDKIRQQYKKGGWAPNNKGIIDSTISSQGVSAPINQIGYSGRKFFTPSFAPKSKEEAFPNMTLALAELMHGKPYNIPIVKNAVNSTIYNVADKLSDVAVNTDFIRPYYKKAAYNIMSQSNVPIRTLDEIKKGILSKGNYRGTGSTNKQRDLLKLYIYGDDAEFTQNNLKPIGVEKYENKYGKLKNYNLDVESISNNIDIDTERKEIIEKIKKDGVYSKPVSYNFSGVLPYKINDNVAGHMNYIYKTPQNKYKLRVQDVWKFDPNDYSKKWSYNRVDATDYPLISKIEAMLAEKAGKPFILSEEYNLDSNLNLEKNEKEMKTGGTWKPNNRANAGSGKKPTKEMLKQEKKIRAAEKKEYGGYSTTGYRADSPDRNNLYNIIPSGRITMQNVPHPVLGIDNFGNKQMMQPGGEYQFPGNRVFEVPAMQAGGVPPIYVDSINDPRYRAYQDSLGLYNRGVEDNKFFREHSYNTPIRKFPFSKVTSYNSVYANEIGKIKPIFAYTWDNMSSDHPDYYRAQWFGYKKPEQQVILGQQINKLPTGSKNEAYSPIPVSVGAYKPKIQGEWYSNRVRVPIDTEDVSALYNEDGTPKYTQGMKEGGIPQRYKNMGFSRVGQKKSGDGQHKWKVLAKKGDSYKVVQGGYRGMQDFKQHHSEERKDRFWDRMGGRDSAKAKDPFSPLYWHKRFGTWEYGGPVEMQDGGWLNKYQEGGNYVDGVYNPSAGIIDKLARITPQQMFLKQMQAKQAQSTIGAAGPRRGAISKAGAIARNPITAAQYALQGQPIPDYFEKGARNPYDYAADVLNPMTYVDAAKRTATLEHFRNMKGLQDLPSAAFYTAMDAGALIGLGSELRARPNILPVESPTAYQAGELTKPVTDYISGSYVGTPETNFSPRWQQQSIVGPVSRKVNRSGLTKEQVLEKAASKNKDAISKMTEQEFQNTVLKPTGEIAEYKPDTTIDEMTYDPTQNSMVLKNRIPMSNQDYVKTFNENLDVLNDIISRKNKSGVEYKVKELTPDGKLVFETPKQTVTGGMTPDQQVEFERYSKNPKEYLINQNVLKQTKDGKWKFEDREFDPSLEFSNIDDAIKHADKTIKNIFFSPKEISGKSTWTVNINPGEWRGNVEDIANTEYFRSIPGLEMSNTTSGVFADNIPRKGTGAYESINQYLKQLDLGRVKPGFNSQTEFSRGAWENFIKSGRGVGFYANPSTVHGTMRTIVPPAALIGAGAAASQADKQKYGGWLKKYK